MTCPPELTDELKSLLEAHLPLGTRVSTLSSQQPNWIAEVSSQGVFVETEKTRASGSGPQLVPAWMLEAAWSRLKERGVLTNKELLSTADLTVKRSSFICAAFALLPGVQVASRRPIELRVDS